LAWQNDDLILYHGCTDGSLYSLNPNGIRVGGSTHHGIDPTVGVQSADLGQGFYATSSLHQAKCWADLRHIRLNRKLPGVRATVVRFDMKRNDLADLEALVFVSSGRYLIIWEGRDVRS